MPSLVFRIPVVVALAAILAAPPAARAGTLENLERERAALLSTLLDPGLDSETRQSRAAPALRRLVDLERMVLRDPGAASGASGGSGALDSRALASHALASRAFADYDLTFLAHASVERGISPLDLWLDRLGLSSDRLLAARIGRR